jgi:hypothetical protein
MDFRLFDADFMAALPVLSMNQPVLRIDCPVGGHAIFRQRK